MESSGEEGSHSLGLCQNLCWLSLPLEILATVLKEPYSQGLTNSFAEDFSLSFWIRELWTALSDALPAEAVELVPDLVWHIPNTPPSPHTPLHATVDYGDQEGLDRVKHLFPLPVSQTHDKHLSSLRKFRKNLFNTTFEELDPPSLFWTLIVVLVIHFMFEGVR